MISRLPHILARAVCATIGVVAIGTIRGAPIEEEEFGPRSGPRGATLFTSVQAASVGMATENTYADPRMWGDRHLEYAVGSIGTGIAIADYDNDGRPDIFVVSKTGRSRLFRNLGAWRFEDVTAAAGIASALWGDAVDGAGASARGAAQPADVAFWTQGAAFADVDNDGWLDLYVCRIFAPNLLFLNRGDGTFSEEAQARGLALDDASGMGAFCDYDRDGWLDVLVQTNMLDATAHPGGQRDRLYRNRGDGRFVEVTDAAGISGATLSHAAIWWDFDRDGWPDLYVASDFGPPDAMYQNRGDGTFVDIAGSALPHMPYSSMGADLGDINNDGLPDLMVADMAATSHEKDQRGMASARAVSREKEERSGVAPQYLRNALCVNTGTGVFQEAAILAGVHATDWTWSVRFEDLDNDGRLDLHVTNGMTREFQNSDLRDRVMRSESLGERMRLLRESPVLNERNLAFRNRGDLRFEDVSESWGLAQEGVSFGAAFGDLDGDGDLDLVFSNFEAPVTLLRNDSDAGHRVIFALRGTRSNRHGVGSAVRIETDSGVQVRSLVLSRGYLSSSEPVLHFGLGGDARIRRVEVTWPSGYVQTFSDLAADRRYTITEPDEPPAPDPGKSDVQTTRFAEVSAALGLDLPSRESDRPEPSRQPLMPVTFHHRGPALAVSDLDGDGADDLVLGGSSLDPARVVRGIGSLATQRRPTILPMPTEPNVPDGPMIAFDADGDGDADLLLTKTGAGVPAASARLIPKLLLNDGRAGFTPAPDGMMPALPISAGALAAADFDRDGRLDVFAGARVLPGRYPASPRSMLLANETTGFRDVADAMAPGLSHVGMVTAALWTDVDGDGWLDLLLALEWGTIRLFRNNAGRGFEDRSGELGFAGAGVGWWNSLAAADFNGDGRLDYVAGNQGLNSIYQASPEEPVAIFSGSFAGTSARQLVEAYREDGRLYPRHTLKALGDAIPPVKRRYGSFNDYAKASLEEILGSEKLAAADRWEATQFASGVFLSQADGRFRFEALPPAAQISVTQGLCAGDFDGDGRADVCAVHNNHSPVHAIGRFDGGVGQVLLGDGRGGFIVVPPRESGLVVPGDAKALVVLDLNDDGAPDFVCSRNNSTLLVFENRSAVGRHFLRVVLRGPSGNPTAIGARVVVRLADGSSQVAEIAAGSGYRSQSSPTCFFGYTRDNPPDALEVRWPSGAVTRHDVAADARTVTLVAP